MSPLEGKSHRLGPIGIITGGCSNQLATCHRPKTRRAAMTRPWHELMPRFQLAAEQAARP